VTPPGRRPRHADSTVLLFVATVPQPIRYFYLPYAAHFRANGWRLIVATRCATDEPAFQANFDRVIDLPISRSIRDWRNYAFALRAMRRLLDGGPDLVHVHTPIAAFLVRLAAATLPAARRPGIVYTAHGFHFHRAGRPLTNWLYRTAERVVGRWTDRLIVINEEDEAAALRARLVPAGRLIRMPGVGIDLDHYARSAIAPAEIERAGAASSSGGGPLFVVVGELHPNKRHDDVLRALAGMRHGDARLVIVGDGRSRAGLESLTRKLGLEPRVRFLGFVEDVRPYLATATGLLLASQREGLPRSVMEAMALEVPVIVSAARGNTELVDASLGQVVPIGSVTGLAAAMDRLIDDPDEARAKAERARERMHAYAIASLIQRHESVYAEVLREKRRGSAAGTA
jgi:glycosyltransferase involved in cell wall biosynthesis